MKNTNNPTICYQCKYRCPLVRDAHSSCTHPNHHSLNIQADEYGIKSGWFNFPHNFDPVWLRNCDGYLNEGENNEQSNSNSNEGRQI